MPCYQFLFHRIPLKPHEQPIKAAQPAVANQADPKEIGCPQQMELHNLTIFAKDSRHHLSFYQISNIRHTMWSPLV